MNRKVIAISITVVFTLVTFLPTVSASNKSNDDPQNKSIFGLGSYINLEYDEDDVTNPIMPRGIGRSIDLNIQYGVLLSDRFLSRLIFWLCIGRFVNIKLEIIDKPQWCYAFLDPETLKATISNEEQNLSSFLSIKVNEDAPAYGLEKLVINASVDDFKGPFGLTWISGDKTQLKIPLLIGYLPLIKTEFPLGDQIEISPYNRTKIPIKITNLGNGRTEVLSEVDNCSKAWEVDIVDSIIIDIGETKTIYLTVKTDHEFEERPVILKFTPSFAENPLDIGDSRYTALFFINDGSYKEEVGLEIDITILIIIIVVIILILVFVTMLKRKKQ